MLVLIITIFEFEELKCDDTIYVELNAWSSKWVWRHDFRDMS